MANTERIPAGIHNAIDYEYRAPEVLGAQRFAYIAGGSGLDVTVAANRSAFGRWASVPRLLRDVRGGHSRLQLADMALPHPLCWHRWRTACWHTRRRNSPPRAPPRPPAPASSPAR